MNKDKKTFWLSLAIFLIASLVAWAGLRFYKNRSSAPNRSVAPAQGVFQ